VAVAVNAAAVMSTAAAVVAAVVAAVAVNGCCCCGSFSACYGEVTFYQNGFSSKRLFIECA
jgi:hypothetical protein